MRDHRRAKRSSRYKHDTTPKIFIEIHAVIHSASIHIISFAHACIHTCTRTCIQTMHLGTYRQIHTQIFLTAPHCLRMQSEAAAMTQVRSCLLSVVGEHMQRTLSPLQDYFPPSSSEHCSRSSRFYKKDNAASALEFNIAIIHALILYVVAMPSVSSTSIMRTYWLCLCVVVELNNSVRIQACSSHGSVQGQSASYWILLSPLILCIPAHRI
jgi:hypothetical protein